MIKFNVGVALLALAAEMAKSNDIIGVDGSFVTIDVSNVQAEDRADCIMMLAEEIRDRRRDEVDTQRIHGLTALAKMVASKAHLARVNKSEITQADQVGSHSLPTGDASITDSSAQQSVESETHTEEVSEDGQETDDEGIERESENEA